MSTQHKINLAPWTLP